LSREPGAERRRDSFGGCFIGIGKPGFAPPKSASRLAGVFARPGADDRQPRGYSMGLVQLGMKPLSESIEIAERYQVELILLTLRSQTYKKIMHTSGELDVTPEQDFHVHLGNG
jgi:hypothetical protein